MYANGIRGKTGSSIVGDGLREIWWWKLNWLLQGRRVNHKQIVLLSSPPPGSWNTSVPGSDPCTLTLLLLKGMSVSRKTNMICDTILEALNLQT